VDHSHHPISHLQSQWPTYGVKVATSGSETGLCSRLIHFVYHSTLGLRVIKKKQKVTTSPHSTPKLRFSIPSSCSGARRNPVSCGTNQGARKRRFSPALRAGGSVVSPHGSFSSLQSPRRTDVSLFFLLHLSSAQAVGAGSARIYLAQ